MPESNRAEVSEEDYRRIMATLIQRAMRHLPNDAIDRLIVLKQRLMGFRDA